MNTRVLLTGFEPFGGDDRNPSLEAVRIVENRYDRDGVTLTARPLAVEFSRAKEQLAHFIAQFEPDIVVCVGLAGGRSDVTLERVAINLADARIPDNAGDQPVDEPLERDGAPAYFTTLPVKEAVLRIRQEGLPASLSYSAGTYVCNAAMYHVLHLLDGTSARGGFIHVPNAFSDTAPMTLEGIARAIELSLDTFVSVQDDSSVSMGREY